VETTQTTNPGHRIDLPKKQPRESNRTVFVAIVCDLAIALTKFIAGAFTGSSAMFSEGIHSVVDSSNGFLLLWGKRASRRPSDDEHPFGYGKELYFWSLLVALLIFSLGGGMSIYEGVSQLRHPLPLQNVNWNYAVLSIAGIFELATVVVAARDFRRAEGNNSFWRSFRKTKDPTVSTVLLNNIAALIGLFFAFTGILLERITAVARFDGIASVLIGFTLSAVAILLAIECKSLLVGEGLDESMREEIRDLAQRDPAVKHVGLPHTMYLGPNSILLALDIQFHDGCSATEIASAVDRLEKNVRAENPHIDRIFIEAEVFRSRS
jgi:cation diffusion facilitator family transporter